MNLTIRVGLNIQNLRRQANLTQEKLAHNANIDRSYISEIELGKRSVSLPIIERIADALGVDPEVLLRKRD